MVCRNPILASGRRRAVNTKISDDVRAKLEEACRMSGRTLSHEIEWRLEQSFLANDFAAVVRMVLKEEADA